jgi:hypothetical protein
VSHRCGIASEVDSYHSLLSCIISHLFVSGQFRGIFRVAYGITATVGLLSWDFLLRPTVSNGELSACLGTGIEFVPDLFVAVVGRTGLGRVGVGGYELFGPKRGYAEEVLAGVAACSTTPD